MADTFYIREDADCCSWTTVTLPVVGIDNNGVNVLEHACMFGIMNDVGSDRILRIKEIRIAERGVRGATTGGLYPFEIVRASALTAARDLTSLITKLDSNYGALPSQVTLQAEVGTLTVSGTTLRRSPIAVGNTGAAAGLYHRASRWGGGFLQQLNGPTLFNNHFPSDIQGQRLAAGEALCLRGAVEVNQAPKLFGVSIWFKDVTNSYYYMADTVVSYAGLTAQPAMLALSNGSGSGITIEVSRVEVYEIGITTATTGRSFMLEPISGLSGGASLTATPLDSNATALSSGVLIRRGGVALQAGQDSRLSQRSGGGGDATPIRRIVAQPFGINTALASGLIGGLRFKRPFDRAFSGSAYADTTLSDFVLREGEGLGIFNRNAMGYGGYEIAVTMTVEDTSSPGGGGARAFAFCG